MQVLRKVATMPQYQYDGEKNGAQWRLIVKPYFISKAPEIAGILRSIEDHEDQSATVSNLATRGLGVHPETIRSLSADLWGFLTLNLQGSARLWVNNSEPMEGFDIWRKLMKVVRSRSEIRRHELLSQLHRPNTAPKLSDVLLALERWDGSLREYIEAGGQPLLFEERRAATLNILPAKFREDVFFRIPAMQESMAGATMEQQDSAYHLLRAQLQRQVEMTTQWAVMAGREQPLHVLPGGSATGGEAESQPYDDTAVWDDAWACFVYKGKGKGKGKSVKGKGKGKTTICSNCGSKEHWTQQCPKPAVPWAERPCHNCGKKGHLSSGCPDRQKQSRGANALGAEPAAEQAPKVHAMMLMHELTLPNKVSCPDTSDRLTGSFCQSPVELRNRFSALDAHEEEDQESGKSVRFGNKEKHPRRADSWASGI